MAKFLYIYSKRPVIDWNQTIEKARSSIPTSEPDDLVISADNEFLYLSSESGVSRDNFSFATGTSRPNDPPAKSPLYSFRLLSSEGFVQAETDLSGWRAVWYIIQDDRILISSSQTTIVHCLNGFKPNQQAIAWMLTSGCIGNESWDMRVSRLHPMQTINIDKKAGTIEISDRSADPSEDMELPQIFDQIFKRFDSLVNWGCTLSGGVDSRATALAMHKFHIPFMAYSWGEKGSDSLPGSDVATAFQVAQKLAVPLNYYELNQPKQNEVSGVLNTFVEHTEGRIDHFQTFGDRLAFWDRIAANGVSAVLRSDEAFGWIRTTSEKDVRISVEMNRVDDYNKVRKLFELSGLEPPVIAHSLNRLDNESIPAYRDRLYRTWRIPNILGPLSEPALTNMEVVNPLLHSDFLHWSEGLADSERTDKKKYKEYIDSLMPEISYASKPSVRETEEIIIQGPYFDFLYQFIQSSAVTDLLGENARKFIVDGYVQSQKKEDSAGFLFRTFKNLVPYPVKKVMRNSIIPYNIGFGRLVLRLYIIHQMHRLLKQ